MSKKEKTTTLFGLDGSWEFFIQASPIFANTAMRLFIKVVTALLASTGQARKKTLSPKNRLA